MKSEQGKYVSAMGYHDKYEANANSPTIGPEQIWEVIFKGDDMVSLKGAHGRYLRWYGNGQVKADAEKPNPWETFIVEDVGNGKLAFFQISYNKKNYLTASGDGALTNQAAAKAGTKFEIVPAPKESFKNLFGCTGNEICKMSMKSEQGKYVSAMGYHDKYEANANSPTIGSDQIWEVIFKGDGEKVSLKGAHGRYMRWYGNRQNRQVKADAEKPNPWETFIVEDMGNGKLMQKNLIRGKLLS